MHRRRNIFFETFNIPYQFHDSGYLCNEVKNNVNFIQRLRLEKKLEVHNGCVNTICWNDGGQYILSGSDDRRLVITDPYTGKVLISLRSGHRANIFSAKFMPNTRDNQVISCSGDGLIYYTVLDREEEATNNGFDCHLGTAYEVLTVPQDPYSFLSCGEDGTVRWFDLRIKTRCNKENCKDDILINCRRAVTAIANNPMAPYQLGVGCSDSSVRIFDRRMLGTKATGNYTGRGVMGMMSRFAAPGLEDQYHRITSLVFSQDGKQVLVSYSSENLCLFDLSETDPNCGRYMTEDQTKDCDGVKRHRPIKRLRLRGDWSDTGPSARPQRERGDERSQVDRAASTLSDMLTRWLEGFTRHNDENDNQRSQESENDSNQAVASGSSTTNEVGQPSGSITSGNQEAEATSSRTATEVSEELAGASSVKQITGATSGTASHETSKSLTRDSLGEQMGEPMASESTESDVTDKAAGSGLVTDSNVQMEVGSEMDESSQSVELGTVEKLQQGASAQGGSDRPSDPLQSPAPTLTPLETPISQENHELMDIGSKASCNEPKQTSDVSQKMSTVLTDVDEKATDMHCYLQLNVSNRNTLGETPTSGQCDMDDDSCVSLSDARNSTEAIQDLDGKHVSCDLSDTAINSTSKLSSSSARSTTSGSVNDPGIARDTESHSSCRCSPDVEQSSSHLSNHVQSVTQDKHFPSNTTAVTGQSTAVPGQNTAMLDQNTAVSDQGTAVPDQNTMVSESSEGAVASCSNTAVISQLEAVACDTKMDYSDSANSDPQPDNSDPQPTTSTTEATTSKPGRRLGHNSAPTGTCSSPDLTDDESDSDTVMRTKPHDEPSLARRHEAAKKLQRLYRKCQQQREDEEINMMQLPQPKMTKVYKGHRNSRTMIKEATFWGTDYVMSGSDCGHIFVWDKHTCEIVMLLEGDKHVVNCIQPHPFDPVLATSGIDYDVKIWTPSAAEPYYDKERAKEILSRNEIMLEETRDTITVPSSFMLRMLASLNHFRSAHSSRATPEESSSPSSSSDE